MKRKGVLIGAYVPKEVKEQMKLLAKENYLPVSELLRRMIVHCLTNDNYLYRNNSKRK